MALAAEVRSIVEKAVSAPNGPAGLVYGAIDAGGNLLVCEAAGRRALDKDEPMTTDACFPLYSTTKLLGAIGYATGYYSALIELILRPLSAMQLVEQGQLSLDEPIHTLLPEILNVNYLGPDGFLVVPAPPAYTEKITLRMLLSHTAGFGYGIFDPNLADHWRRGGGPDELSGTREGTLGIPLVNEIDDEITFHLTPTQEAKLVAQHQRAEDGVLRVSGMILKEETVKSMFDNQVPDGVPGLGETIIDARPELTYPVHTPPGMRKGWDALPTGRSANSGAWAGLANLYYTVDPTKGVATMIMSQSFPFFDPAVTGPFLEAEKAVYAWLK
ncbi:beta-lactamase/transpeptidase-like protein [Auricularia subglabra TFB-10046 SS5]|uniref:Beta-lactamase/transpeptidase-like protein n=1 Tax=Auricularia subglabra (strain TFB-10046 / SS5) TaxID=717982 RepID=J0LGZ5_AURST|nr:beta-lactamase/transpeptidase-like protein [Auricularia subglabra TFB-10046 SS5]